MAVLNPITFVTGPLGCGKSYFAMKNVMEYLAAGKIVATNFDLVGDWWNTAYKMGHSPKKRSYPASEEWKQDCLSRALRFDRQDDLYDYQFDGPGEDQGLVVLDESGLSLNARLYQMRQKQDADRYENPIKALQWYINMRKIGWTALILAHSSKHLDNQVQDMGGGIVKLRNFARVKLPLVGVGVTRKPRFMAAHFDPQMSSKPIYKEHYGLRPAIANHYKSQDTFEWMPEMRGIRPHRQPGPLLQPAGTYAEELRRASAAAGTGGTGGGSAAGSGTTLSDWLPAGEDEL
ncbi:zonular occludens toxin domain-containing protein [Micromonospora sp. RV43]|nr:zonular occludens toxin domain-containing protein [Micromonospora sp. RV43]